MLGKAGIAFLIMTSEDEQKDGKVHARMNVIQEAGLFQGRLCFSLAIIVLEEGCEEFSNVQGLGQIRFPAGNIKAVFEEVRRIGTRRIFRIEIVRQMRRRHVMQPSEAYTLVRDEWLEEQKGVVSGPTAEKYAAACKTYPAQMTIAQTMFVNDMKR